MRLLTSRHVLCHVLGSKGNGVLSHDRLTGRRMGSDEYTVPHLEVIHGFFLEVVQLERILTSQRESRGYFQLASLAISGTSSLNCGVSLMRRNGPSRRTLLILWLTSTT